MVDLPNDPNLMNILDQADVQIAVAPPRGDNVLARTASALLIPSILLGFWIWMLIDCATQEAPEGNTKIAWVIIILFTNFLGALIYFLVRKPQRRKELGR
ncbi:PLD nuclease N-terminal domain-containing protein [Leptolyngbya sp. NM2-A1]